MAKGHFIWYHGQIAAVFHNLVQNRYSYRYLFADVAKTTRETLPFASANLQRRIIISLETLFLVARIAKVCPRFLSFLYSDFPQPHRQRGKVGSEVVE